MWEGVKLNAVGLVAVGGCDVGGGAVTLNVKVCGWSEVEGGALVRRRVI